MARICILLTLIVTAQAYAQPGKLVKAGSPQPASVEGYHKGEQTTTLTYPIDEDEETIDRYIGDATSGRIYPNRYLPLAPEKWLTGKRATRRTYEDKRSECYGLTVNM